MSKWQPLLLSVSLLPVVVGGGVQGQTAIRAATAARQVGQVVIVEDWAAQVVPPQGTSVYFLNFGSEFPHQVLTVVIPATVAVQVPGLVAAAAGAFVRVRGTVILTDDGPAIRCSSADQVEILAAGSLARGGQVSPATPMICVGGPHGCGGGHGRGHGGHSCASGCRGCASWGGHCR
jgi:hypothetical protein